MASTIRATVGEIVSHYSRANGPTEEQRVRQCAEAIQTRAGVGPAQLEAVHVYLAACRVLEQRRAEMQRAAKAIDEICGGDASKSWAKNKVAELDRAEAAWNMAHSAWVEAESHLLRLCENVEVEVSHAV